MGLRKGQTNNPNGRPPGKPNRATSETKEVVSEILQKNFSAAKVNRDLQALEPRQRLDVLTKLLSYVLPRPTEGTLQIDGQFDVKNLNEKDLDEIIERLLQPKEN